MSFKEHLLVRLLDVLEVPPHVVHVLLDVLAPLHDLLHKHLHLHLSHLDVNGMALIKKEEKFKEINKIGDAYKI